MIGVLGSAALLFGLALLAAAEGQPQAAIGVALFMSGTAVLMREISARASDKDMIDDQAEALEDARDAAFKHHFAFLARRDLEDAAEAQHEANQRYWFERHGWRNEVNQ